MAWMVSVLLSVTAALAGTLAPEARPGKPAWLEKDVLFYHVRYTDADAAQMDRAAAVLTSFHDDFVKLSGMAADSFAESRVEVRLYPPGSADVQLGFVSLFGGPTTRNGRPAYEGILKMPGPTAYDGSQTSTSGHAMDKDYFDKLLVHEVAPVYLEMYARSHGASFHAAPGWFEQGAEEYFAVYHSTAYWRGEGLRCYERTFREQRGIDADFGINVQDPYNDGLMMMRFIAETFGEKAILVTIASNEPTFGKRLKAGVGVEYGEFERRLGEWVEKMKREERARP